MNWAWGRQCGSPSAKLILMCLADFANQDGECFPSNALLAEKTEQSPNTVRRRLQELEDQGLIERQPQHRPNGSQTVDIIRLNMGQEARPEHGPRQEAPPPKLEGGPLPNWEGAPATSERPPLPTVGGPEPPYEPSSEPTPLTPHGGMGVGSADQGTMFDAFRAGWGVEASGASWPKAHAAWSRLGQDDRASALMGLPRYLDDCRSKTRKVCHPVTYLNERRWEGFSVVPKAVQQATRIEPDDVAKAVEWARSGARRDAWVFVEAGSEAWAAWMRAFRHAGYTPPGAGHVMAPDGVGGFARRCGCSFPMAFPPPISADTGGGTKVHSS